MRIMSIFSWFKKEKEHKGHVLDDEDRATAKELRDRKKEIEMLKLDRDDSLNKLRYEKQKLDLEREIEELRGLYDDDEDEITPQADDDTTTALMKMFAPMLINKFSQQQPTQPPAYSSPSPVAQPQSISTPSSKVSLSDEELLKLWAETPSIAKAYAKNMGDDTIITSLKAKLPNVDDDTLQRGLKIIRS